MPCSIFFPLVARTVGGGTAEIVQVLSDLEARVDLARRLGEEFDLELLEAATRIVRDRVEPKTWDAYFLTAVQGCRAADVAARLGMRVGSVYQAKSSVIQMLQDEVHRLEGEFGPREASRRAADIR